MSGGFLYQKVQWKRDVEQLVLPYTITHRRRVLEVIHDEMGHFGIEKTLDEERERFFWPKMAKAVEQKYHNCEHYIKRKARVEQAAEPL